MIELEPASGEFNPPPDHRPRMRPPPPVRLVAVDHVRLEAIIGQEPALDAFYIDLLQFLRRIERGKPVYEAANFRIEFIWFEKSLQRPDFRMLGIEIQSLAEVEMKLLKLETDYVHQHGLPTGQESLVLQDPAGNWLELMEYRRMT